MKQDTTQKTHDHDAAPDYEGDDILDESRDRADETPLWGAFTQTQRVPKVSPPTPAPVAEKPKVAKKAPVKKAPVKKAPAKSKK